MNRRRLLGMLLVPALLAMAGCASTGGSTRTTANPETRTLQHVEVDGSVRVRANHYRR